MTAREKAEVAEVMAQGCIEFLSQISEVVRLELDIQLTKRRATRLHRLVSNPKKIRVWKGGGR